MPIAPSHPFISFELNLGRLTYEDWLLLGEASSKIAHVIGVPLQPRVAQELHLVALVKGVQATTAIEGNTLTEEQVKAIAESKLQLPPSQEYLQREVENILAACNEFLPALIENPTLKIDGDWIRAQNALVLKGLEVEEGVIAGEWRVHNVGVAQYRPPDWQYVEPLMRRFDQWMGELLEGADAALACPVHLLRAIVAHLYLAWIHPFGDGNGRTARMLEFALLLRSGVPSPSAHVLSNHYNKTRSAYYRELNRASKTGDAYGFIHYSLVGLVDGLREQVDLIQDQQIRVTWTQYVYSTLDPHSSTDLRRAHLLLDLAAHAPDGCRSKDLPGLTPRMAKSYAAKTDKTLSRDLNALRHMGLLRLQEGRWIAPIDNVRAFRPFTVDATPWTPRARNAALRRTTSGATTH